MSNHNLETARAYYNAVAEREIVRVKDLIHMDVVLTAPFATVRGKDLFLAELEGFCRSFDKITLHALCGDGEQVMAAYKLDYSSSIGVVPAAALLNFRDGQIVSFQLYYDTRPYLAQK